MIGILISVTGSIEGLPVSVEYLSSTRSYMKSKSIYLSIFRKRWSCGTSSSIDYHLLFVFFLSSGLFFVIMAIFSLISILILYHKYRHKR